MSEGLDALQQQRAKAHDAGLAICKRFRGPGRLCGARACGFVGDACGVIRIDLDDEFAGGGVEDAKFIHASLSIYRHFREGRNPGSFNPGSLKAPA